MNVSINIEYETGNMIIVADSLSDQFDIKESLDEHGFWSTMYDIFESYSTNGSFTSFDASDANPFVGLTSAPCIAESIDYHDDGSAHVVGRLWYYQDYAVSCPLEELIETGQVKFYLV